MKPAPVAVVVSSNSHNGQRGDLYPAAVGRRNRARGCSAVKHLRVEIARTPFSVDHLVMDRRVDALRAARKGEAWIGETPDWFGITSLFGGFILGQATYVAAETAPAGRRIHSLHAYFLRSVTAGPPLVHRITTLRQGKSSITARVDSAQEEQLVFTMTFSCAADGKGYEYELPVAAGVPPPEKLEVREAIGPWQIADLGPTPAQEDGTMRSTRRAWLRTSEPVDPDDHSFHAALVAMFSDVTGVGGRPLHLEEDYRGIISLDHALWFHRPLRGDDWMFYDLHSLINTAGRGLLRGTIHGVDRRLGASVAQEQLLIPIGPRPS